MTPSAAEQQVVVTPDAASSESVLTIVSGVHRGVRLALARRDYRIGSTTGADIILRDAGIAAEHAILRIGPRSIRLHAVGGNVGIGATVLAQGHGCALRPPVDLTVGEARLHVDIEHPNRAWQPDSRAWQPDISAAVLLAGAVLFVIPTLWAVTPRLGISGAHHTAIHATGAGADAAPLVTASIEARPTRIASPTAAEVEAAAHGLAQHLEAAGIHGLSVTAGGGHVGVTGGIGQSQTAAWTEAEQWFDRIHGGRLLLAANVTVGDRAAPPILDVQAVWFGQRPYVLATDGTRYYKGAFLDNGWTIKEIARDRIILAKAGETIAVFYR